MRKSISTLYIFFISIVMLPAQQLSIEPSFWWSGMQEPELQLLINGENIANYTPTVTSNDIIIKELYAFRVQIIKCCI